MEFPSLAEHVNGIFGIEWCRLSFFIAVLLLLCFPLYFVLVRTTCTLSTLNSGRCCHTSEHAIYCTLRDYYDHVLYSQ